MDFNKIGIAASKSDTVSRPIVAGRVLQYDADFACYNVSNLEETASQSFKRLISLIEMKRVMAGAESVNAHITLGTKSGREAMATQKEYQENRDPDKPIKVRVRELRQMLANYKPTATVRPTFNLHYEADDLICIMQTASIRKNGIESSVIMSGDKDLWMINGIHCDDKSGRLWTVNGFGETSYKEVGNVKPKLVGTGTSWFWHQMIMGDKVDNIPGLAKINNKTLDEYFPLKSRKPRKDGESTCGEAKAVGMLLNVHTNQRASQIVYKAYLEYYGKKATEQFMEQAYLLWMQRSTDSFDVAKFMIDECGLNVHFTEKQKDKIQEFNYTKRK